MRLGTTAVCENHLRIIRFQVAEYFSATFHLEISPIGKSVALKPHYVTNRSITVCSRRVQSI